MQSLAALPGGYVPWSVMSMRPSAVALILNDVLVHGRRHIVECGAGVSTIYVARLLREREGRLVTLEHDAAWAALTRELLAAEGLDEKVTILDAPLEPSRHSPTGSPWYAAETVARAAERPIELLVVDGPPGHGDATARYPALPAFFEHLAPDATVMLDDIRRPGELRIAQEWEERFGLRFVNRFVDGGVAMGRRDAGFLI
jgi:predicted O-methyltransferase YrrM